MLKVLVADESATSRKVLGDFLEGVEDVQVVGRASTGRLALAQARSTQPDLLTVALDMRDLDVVGLIKKLAGEPGAPKILVMTTQDELTSEEATEARQLGALEVLAKPGSPQEEVRFRARLSRILRSLVARGAVAALPAPPRVVQDRRAPVAVVAIGLSTGGPSALMSMVPGLPGDLGVPVLIVQHMPGAFTAHLAQSLDRASPLTVLEAEDGIPVEGNRVYVAPGGRHMKVARERGAVRILLTDDPPENHCRPAADYLFRSVAAVYGERALGVIMTGMGDDGTKGLVSMRAAGAYVLGQDEASSTVYGMPMRAKAAGAVDQVVSLDEMAQQIVRRVRRLR